MGVLKLNKNPEIYDLQYVFIAKIKYTVIILWINNYLNPYLLKRILYKFKQEKI
jgi:hypothetical protein